LLHFWLKKARSSARFVLCGLCRCSSPPLVSPCGTSAHEQPEGRIAAL
jgi:hypothetical protein